MKRGRSPRTPPTTVSPRPNGTKILVVESHRRLAAGVGAVVGDQFQVEEARDTHQALVTLGGGGVALVVVDDELTAGDPFELCKMARVAEGTPAIVLLASTYLAATRVRAARSGVDELIPKPAAISEVLTRVWLCLRRRQLEQGAGQSALAMPVAEPPDLAVTLLDAVELMIAGGRTGRVAVASGARRRGWVSVADGLVVDAQAGPLRGAPALGRLFRWRLTRAEQLVEPVRDRVISVTPADLCAALFQVRAAWPRLVHALPLDQVLVADPGAWTAPAAPASPRLLSVIRLFDGRRRLIDVLDDADVPDPEACRFIADLLARRGLVPGEAPPEVNSHWDAPDASPELFFEAPAGDAETPVGWARTELTPKPGALPTIRLSAPATDPPAPIAEVGRPTPPAMARTITSETAVVDARGLVFGELIEPRRGGRRRELSDTGTRLGWAALAAGGSPFDSTASEILNVASQTRLAVRSTLPRTPSILITDPQGLGPGETTTTLDQPPDQPHGDTPLPARRTRLQAAPNRPGDGPSAAAETTDPMIRPAIEALNLRPARRRTSNEWSAADAPPRRRALALAGVGAVVGMAGSLLVFMRLGAAPVRPVIQAPAQMVVATSPAVVASPAVAPGRPSDPPVPVPVPLPGAPATSPTGLATPAGGTGQTLAAESGAGAPPPEAVATLEDCRRAYARERYSRIVRVCGQALAAEEGRAEPGALAGAMAMLAHAELDRGNYSRAGRWARKALALDPRLPEAYAYLGFVEDQAGRRDEALAAYRSYLRLAPHGRHADDLRAIIDAAP
jgi:CheY-like chemotaxis protein